MKRREFLTVTTLTVAAGMPVVAAARRLKVGIIGGGIVGASIAFHLAEAGAQVVLFEKATPTTRSRQDDVVAQQVFRGARWSSSEGPARL